MAVPKGWRNAVEIPVSVKKHSSGEEYPWGNELEKYEIKDWIAVSAAGLQGQGWCKRNVFSQTPVVLFEISNSMKRYPSAVNV